MESFCSSHQINPSLGACLLKKSFLKSRNSFSSPLSVTQHINDPARAVDQAVTELQISLSVLAEINESPQIQTIL